MPRFSSPLRRLLLLVLLGSTTVTADEPALQPTVLITGANRGIGLEFTRQYAARGWTVIATTRRPGAATALKQLAANRPNVSIDQLDITSESQVAALAAKYRGRPIDLLINNAALLDGMDRQLLGKLDYELFNRTMAINATGPMRVSEAFLPNVAASGQKKIITLSSAAGSHGLLNPPANLYPYRASKAALNFLMHNLALDVAQRGIIVGLINPGLVDTRGVLNLKPGQSPPEEFAALMPLIRAGKIRLITPEESVTAMLELIDGLTPARSGVFLNYDGQTLPW
ncbi:MAG: SDR family oxidoreductase [Gammaproteobacteria bacterium]|nr:SDR family oxidoreductase [Gammaproteobacteria bacterium]